MKTRESGSPTSYPQAAGPQGSGRVSGRRRCRSPAAAGGWRATAKRRTDGRRAGGRGRGPGPSYLRTPSAGCRQSPWPQPPPAVRGPRLLCDSDSRLAAASDARPPTSGARGCEPSRWFRGCEQPGPTKKRRAAGDSEDSRPPWRGPWGCSPTSLLRGPRPPGARGAHIRVPGDAQLLLPRPSPPAANTKLPAAAAAAADASRVRWELPGAVVGALAQRFSSPKPLS